MWCNISGEAAGEIWDWSLLGVKGLKHYERMVPFAFGSSKAEAFPVDDNALTRSFGPPSSESSKTESRENMEILSELDPLLDSFLATNSATYTRNSRVVRRVPLPAFLSLTPPEFPDPISLRSWRSQYAVNSVHGRHFVLVADGRMRANDKIMVRGRGCGVVAGSPLPNPLPRTVNFVISSQSPICQQYKMAPVNTVHRILRPPATQAKTPFPSVGDQYCTKWRWVQSFRSGQTPQTFDRFLRMNPFTERMFCFNKINNKIKTIITQ